MSRVVYLPVATAVECDHGVPLRLDCARCTTDWGITDYYERRRAEARRLAGVRCRFLWHDGRALLPSGCGTVMSRHCDRSWLWWQLCCIAGGCLAGVVVGRWLAGHAVWGARWLLLVW